MPLIVLRTLSRLSGCRFVNKHFAGALSWVRTYRARIGDYGNKCHASAAAAATPESEPVKSKATKTEIDYGLYRLVTAYREHGHQKANVDVLQLKQTTTPKELDPAQYGISMAALHSLDGILHVGPDRLQTPDLIALLDDLYCGPVAVEFLHLQNMEEREWFARNFELMRTKTLSSQRKVQLATLMLKSQAFDHFLANKFTTVKRYGGEGAESAMAFYDELFSIAANTNIDDVLIGIAHRGRLNLLVCLLKFPPVVMFQKMSLQEMDACMTSVPAFEELEKASLVMFNAFSSLALSIRKDVWPENVSMQ